ncbi:hypothetical protein OBBRIDRAFT_189322 [Obba rivulosa]|uniref:Uncharacterized protein n=1 Tax=Obba rivulosa TaxID=1052685 RepID=A0A8E2ARB8_9APHY|nr:hypothetical protein OBBRIDRAFT_189322 [Obba rivulosa]
MSPRPPPGDDPRHPDRRPTAPASVVAPTPSEDQQPNEGIDRRRAGLPPAVSSAAPLPRNQRGGYRAHGIAGRGRGEWSHLPRDRHSEFNLADNIWAEVRPGTLPRAGRTLQETNTTAEFLDTEATAIPVPALSRDEKQTVMSLAEVISSANRNPVPPNASSSAERQPRPRKRRKLTPPNNVLSYAGPAIPLSSVQGPHHSTAIEHPHTEKEKSKSSLPCSPTGTAPLPAAAGKADVSVKRERSPSPVLPSAARPVTEGSIRFAPLPRECRSSTRNYQLNRSRWIKGETSKLQAKGLKVERVFVRDDGMVVDWTSSIPVMSDTLLPALAVEPSQAAGDEMEVDDHAAQVPSDSAESRHQHNPRRSPQTSNQLLLLSLLNLGHLRPRY